MKEQVASIGVFDSGLGGISVLKELRNMMPNENYIYFGDSRYGPYGIKNKNEIMNRCITICDFFIEKDVKAIVIACNTATSACVNELRERYANIPIIGMEPALKVATEKKGRQHVLVLATNFTLKEKKFATLMERYAQDNVIYKQPCPKLVEIVEGHQLNNRELVVSVLKSYLESYNMEELQSIVLGCTHFVFFKNYFKELVANHIHIIDGNYGTAKHLQTILQERGELSKKSEEGTLRIYNSSKDDDALLQLFNELINA